MWSPPDPGIGGRGDQLMLQAGRRGEGLERGMGACWLWRAPKIMGARPQIMGARPHLWESTHNNGGAPSSLGEQP
jgi:hypothetical protein